MIKRNGTFVPKDNVSPKITCPRLSRMAIEMRADAGRQPRVCGVSFKDRFLLGKQAQQMRHLQVKAELSQVAGCRQLAFGAGAHLRGGLRVR